VVIVAAGRVVSAGTVAELTAATTPRIVFRAAAHLALDSLQPVLRGRANARETAPGHYVVEGEVDTRMLAGVTGWLADNDVAAGDVRLENRSLEEVFLHVTGGS
jgi:ABC-2 type transport system ATP-binding protein